MPKNKPHISSKMLAGWTGSGVDCGASADKAAYKIDAAPAAEATTPDEVARIDQEQQKNVASGEAARGRTSIKLDPASRPCRKHTNLQQ